MSQGIFGLLLVLGPFILLQRRLHWEIQAIFLILTRRQDIAIVLFSLLFLPGVLIHELSHFLMARILGVRTGRLSVIPRPMADGRLQLGYLETSRVDFLRDALIGIAPLIFGGFFIGYIALEPLGIPNYWTGLTGVNPDEVRQGLVGIFSRADFWVWFYLAFAISSTMMPSRSDRRGWLPVGLLVITLLLIGIALGAGPWIFQQASSLAERIILAIIFVFGTGLVVHLALLIPVMLLRSLLLKLTGTKIV